MLIISVIGIIRYLSQRIKSLLPEEVPVYDFTGCTPASHTGIIKLRESFSEHLN